MPTAAESRPPLRLNLNSNTGKTQASKAMSQDDWSAKSDSAVPVVSQT